MRVPAVRLPGIAFAGNVRVAGCGRLRLRVTRCRLRRARYIHTRLGHRYRRGRHVGRRTSVTWASGGHDYVGIPIRRCEVAVALSVPRTRAPGIASHAALHVVRCVLEGVLPPSSTQTGGAREVAECAGSVVVLLRHVFVRACERCGEVHSLAVVRLAVTGVGRGRVTPWCLRVLSLNRERSAMRAMLLLSLMVPVVVRVLCGWGRKMRRQGWLGRWSRGVVGESRGRV